MRRHKMDGSAGLSGGRRASVNPELTMVNYGLEVDQLVIGDVMMKGDGTTEEVTSITAYAGTHDNYALLTKQGNWYANGVMVDSIVKDLNIEDKCTVSIYLCETSSSCGASDCCWPNTLSIYSLCTVSIYLF